MTRFLSRFRIDLKRACVGMLIALTIMGTGVTIEPKRIEAIVVTEVGTNLIKNAITATQSLVTSGILSSLNLKEITFDGIAWSLAKKVLSQMVRSTIDWINSGFNGKPAFIQNYDDYFLQAADEVATDFIAGPNFNQLCQPLQVPIQIILDLSYRKARDWETESQCTISQAFGNISNFVAGNFEEGGWSMWFKVMSEPQNNIYGAAALAESRLYNNLRAEEENKRTEAVVNKGFLSMKDCSSGKCLIVTPGTIYEDMTNFALQIPGLSLIEADEMNELIGALFAQLGNQAIMGVGGLLGLSQSSDGGVTPSYLDQLEQESLNNGFTGGSKFLTDAIRDEEKYKAIHEKALKDLEKAADDASCSAGSSVLADILELAEKYVEEVESAESLIAVLTLLKQTFDEATDEQLQAVVVEEFQRLQSEEVLHGQGVTTEKTFEIAEKVPALKERADNVCN